ncbi:uncharacterized protein LOC110866671 [Helianthus annuus]|uniref:uncharacterized protein LOC110866671 n=1 Tax=Helianthus annuus TaxID=4232 RepID=UPI000B9085C2|nr:uncharacterized protein LOC110866671 [Helianthus annuus]
MEHEDLSSTNLANFWGNHDFGMESVEASGLSGGLLCLWDRGIFDVVSSVKDKNFLLVNGRLKGSQYEINVINVYAPQNAADKLNLWNKIRDTMEGFEGLWVIVGDFNAVRSPEERRNSNYKNTCAKNFNDFINTAGLVEYNLNGRKYTCVRDNGRKLSKLDRFLVCSKLIFKWPDACLRGLTTKYSDHCPLVLTVNKKNFGAKPFRIFSSWLEELGFQESVEKAVSLLGCSDGPADIRLMKKFTVIRSAIKEWRSEHLKKGKSLPKRKKN